MRRIMLLLVAAPLALLVAPSLHAEVYYSDSFDGVGLLHGSSPTVNLGGATWFANEGTGGEENMEEVPENAIQLGSGFASVGSREDDLNNPGGASATLPISLVPNGTYFAEVTVQTDATGLLNEGWMWLSFTNSATYQSNVNGGGLATEEVDVRPIALALVTNGGSYHSYAPYQDIMPFENGPYAGDEDLPAVDGGLPRTLGIQIDVDGEGAGTVTYFNNGEEVVRANPLFLTPEVVASVSGITMGRYVTAGTFDDFLLDVDAPDPPALVGDYNEDGVVDAADYTVWRNNLGGETLPNRGEGLAGPIDEQDYLQWKEHFGAGAPAAAALLTSAQVPEPATLSLMTLLASALLLSRRSARWRRSSGSLAGDASQR